MKVIILYPLLPANAAKDELDVLDQVKLIKKALKELEINCGTLQMSLDLIKASHDLIAAAPDLVFNLVESLNGSGQYIYLAPTLLDVLKIPYSGGQTEAIFLTTNKLLCKELLHSHNLPTPPWQSSSDILMNDVSIQMPFILKPVWEDASIGLNDSSIFFKTTGIKKIISEKSDRFGECFAETFIDGREFNLSVIAGAEGPNVLSPAEIIFKDFPKDKPRIVGYQAKWEIESFEYCNTIHRFEFGNEDQNLIMQMSEIVYQCWDLFKLKGYARVDFRVDKDGKPWILEINANPCIAPNSGFMAAAERAGLSNAQVIKRIIDNALLT